MKSPKPAPKLRSIKRPTKPPEQTTNLNTFGLSFELVLTDEKTVKFGNMQSMFQGHPVLIVGEKFTELGYKMLIDALAFNIKTLCESAEKETSLKAQALKAAVVSKLEITAAKRVKLIGV